jgi:hypothetical protein
MTSGDATHLITVLAGIRDALARLAAVAQQPMQAQSSVELSKNPKGQTPVVVKVYHADPVEASTLAQGLYDQLAFRYGQPADDAA